MTDCLLEMRNISKEFSGVWVLQDVNLSLNKGEVHVLLGENGAGKSTLIKILSGAYTKTSGEILINGEKVDIKNPSDAFGYKIGVIYQEFNLNPFMSIYENLFLGKEYTNALGVIDKNRCIKEAKRALERVGLDVSPRTLVKDLSVAQMQLVEIAKAIMSQVQILVFDEPTATLTEREIEKLFQIICELRTNGVGIIYISHRMKELKQIGDRCTVLRDGNYIATVKLSEVEDCDLVRMMVGRTVEFEKRTESFIDKNEDVLSVEDLSCRNLIEGISFTLKKGEILGVAGLVGSGRTEMAKCIIGEYKPTRGTITIKGKQVKIKEPCDAISHGIVYLSEDRKNEGLIVKHDVKTNATLAGLDKLIKGGLINTEKEEDCANDLVKQFNIKTNGIKMLIKHLSGGNQQKVVIAKWVNSGADIYIFDEPTRGIDVGARQEIYSIMEDLARAGASIIMISSDLVEIIKMSDRVIVMHQGKVGGILENDVNLCQETILNYAIGRQCK
ncbi:D-ribose transporter ATP-binding protein [Ornatilinea apprima]|uniref:D-ribose transporter ATP-binding protein n=1 Tax=Ornatilinea apprima TaxID=1134406 RepID=A0A0P6X9P8_9CHLR|nr:sugar ABC transporter ATP-binding protein [Ornatilinea apprima]KPL78789.1 D-ribose transporter ATP-binding protein [Ornatilinea apprima]